MDSSPISPLPGVPSPLRPGQREQRRREQRPFHLPRPGSDEPDAEDPTTLVPEPRRQAPPAPGDAALEPATSDAREAALDPRFACEDEAGRHIDVRG